MRTKFVREATASARAEFDKEVSEIAAGVSAGRFLGPQARELRKLARLRLQCAQLKAKYQEMKLAYRGVEGGAR
jgi:hypothetical protein